MAGLALLHPLHGDRLFAAEGRLLKADGQGHADALAPLGSIGIGAPSAAAEAAAEEAAENVAQVAEVEAAVESGAGAEVGVHAGMAVLVIPGLLIGVRQDLIGLVDLLEVLLGILVAGIQVRMVLPGHFFICFFDLVLRGALGHAQDLVVITLVLCHIENSSYSETPYQGQRMPPVPDTFYERVAHLFLFSSSSTTL